MTNDYKDFHGLAPTQAAHRTYLACIQWQPAHTCCCRRTRASLGSLGCCASLLWFRAGWWCCWWQGCCCSYNMDGGNQGDAVAARWWWCYLCKLLWCDGESRTTAMDLVWIVDIALERGSWVAVWKNHEILRRCSGELNLLTKYQRYQKKI